MINKVAQRVKGVRDSKLLSASQREELFDKIIKHSSAYGIGIVEAWEIDVIGIEEAVKKAMLLALKNLEEMFGTQINYVIVDGSRTKPLKKYESKRILKGGLYHYSIAAGSILAKVTRDRIMKKLAKEYPEYGFGRHVGYGTKLHQEKLLQFGTCPIHRKSYAPIAKLLL